MRSGCGPGVQELDRHLRAAKAAQAAQQAVKASCFQYLLNKLKWISSLHDDTSLCEPSVEAGEIPSTLNSGACSAKDL